jgi:hypothetical protein
VLSELLNAHAAVFAGDGYSTRKGQQSLKSAFILIHVNVAAGEMQFP